MDSTRTLLLTGSTGFVGRNLLLQALENPRYRKIIAPVRNKKKLLDQLAGEGYSDLPRGLEIIEGEAGKWAKEKFQVDEVVHSAGTIFAQTKEHYRKVNVEGTLSLLRQINTNAKVIILSSLSASGPCPTHQKEKNESDQDTPVTWYGQSKLEMETKVQKEFPKGNILFLRPPIIFGARDSASLPLFKMAKNPIQFKSGLHLKHYSFISVNDLVKAIFQVFESPTDWKEVSNKRFFVTSDQIVTDKELIETTAALSHRPSRILRVPQSFVRIASYAIDAIPAWRASVPSLSVDRAKEIWPKRWVASSKAFEKQFAWKAQESLDSTLQQTHAWYVQSGHLS